MVYPNFKNKHLERALFSPDFYVKFRKFLKGHKKPKKYILIYSSSLLRYFLRKYKPKKIRLYSLITIYLYKDIGLIYNKGIGAPNATTILEELIALGGKEFLSIGTAGGLKDFGVFLCKKALRDEGTSHHYIREGKYTYPDKDLTKRLQEKIKQRGLETEECITWTIDAPYRETIAEIKHYKKEGIKTVEMEASALFAVAKVRNVKIASAFIVSDLLMEDKWDPQFNEKHVKEKMNLILDASIECLDNFK